MWIVDDDGDMFNTDHYYKISLADPGIVLWRDGFDKKDVFKLFNGITDEEILTRYNDLVEKLTGERIDI